MEKQVFLSKNAAQTQKFAAEIARNVCDRPKGKSAVILALEGELGGGKTTFVQGLASVLGIKEKITSPTFVIMRHFNILAFKHFNNFYHIDCYRLDNVKDLVDLGFGEIIKDPKNLIVIEWADKVRSLMPKNTVWLKFEWLGENQRKIYKF